jgi:hypothetical protein
MYKAHPFPKEVLGKMKAIIYQYYQVATQEKKR